MNKFNLISLAFLSLVLITSCSEDNEDSVNVNGVITSEIAGTDFHNPNSTWWGYNMSKAVRYNSTIYLGVVESFDNTGSVVGNFKIFKKNDSDINFTLVESFPASRPGNLLIDSLGELHVITFEPYDILVSDSIGSLVVHSSAGLQSGTPSFSRTELVTATNSNQEFVNIRVGAAISKNDHIAVAYGLNQYNPISGDFLIQLHINDGGGWRTESYSDFPVEQATEYYYPFVSFDENDDVYILPVQDEYYIPPGGTQAVNLYYKIPYLKYKTLTDDFDFEMLEDVSQSPLAATEYHLLEQSDVLYNETNSNTYFIYKKRVSSSKKSFVAAVKDSSGQITKKTLNWADSRNANWLQLFVYNGKVYAVFISYDAIYVADFDTEEVKRLNLSVPTSGYLYLTGQRGGTSLSNSKIDFYIIPGDSTSYPNSTYKIHSVPKAEIEALF